MGDLDVIGGPYENPIDNPDNFDYIRVLTDDDLDGEFDVLTEFLAVDDLDSDFFGFLAAEDGTILYTEFQTLTFDLPSSATLDLRIDVFTDATNERVGIDHIRVIGEGNLPPGDFNVDGVLDAIDIDTPTAAVGGGDLEYDLDGDGFVTDADRDVWVIDLRKTWFGDADMDGLFSSADFVEVFVIGEYEDDIDGNSTWGEGDWDGDADFTSGDFVRALSTADMNWDRARRQMRYRSRTR